MFQQERGVRDPRGGEHHVETSELLDDHRSSVDLYVADRRRRVLGGEEECRRAPDAKCGPRHRRDPSLQPDRLLPRSSTRGSAAVRHRSAAPWRLALPTAEEFRRDGPV